MAEKMRAAVLVKQKKFEIQERPTPEPGSGEVLIRVRSVGICGSDTHYFDGRRDKEPNTVYPFVLGHEYSGEVAEVGPDCSNATVGARVVPEPQVNCGTCESCAAGMPNLCPNVRFAGSDKVEGALCEYYISQDRLVHPIPDSVSFDDAATVEPLAIGLHLVETLIQPQPEWSYAVIGAGPIGLVTTFAISLHSPSRIFASEKIPQRMEAASFYGATDTFDATTGDFTEYVLDRTNGRGVDVAVEAAGEVDTVNQTIKVTCPGGIAVIEGIAQEPVLPFDIQSARRRELTVLFGRRSRDKDERAIELVADGKFDASHFVTHTLPLEKTQEAFEIATDYSDGVIKAVVNP